MADYSSLDGYEFQAKHMTRLTLHELRRHLDETFELLRPKGDGPSVTKAILHLLAGILEKQIENEQKLNTILETLMALDVSTLNDLATQLNADAQVIAAYIASNPNTGVQDQAAFDTAVATAKTAFNTLHQQVQALAIPPDSTVPVGTGGDTVTATAGQ